MKLAALKTKLEDAGLSPFAVSVLMATADVPKGETRSYGEIAKIIGKPGSARAVGSALRNNPFPGETPGVHVPCHRVIRANGSTTGFMGSTDPSSAENKKKIRLLTKEGALKSLK